MGTADTTWKERIHCYTQETTLHGISHVAASHRSSGQRILWALLFLLALSGFLYCLVTGLIRYHTYPITTNMEYKLQNELQFPSVTLCNYNIIRKSFLEDLNNPYVRLAVDFFNPINQANINLSDPGVKKEMSKVKMDNIGSSSGHLKKDMFQACHFMSANFTEFPCRFHEDLFVSASTQHGFCYTFNPQSYIEKYGTLVSDRAGQAGGLHFLINLQQREYIVGSKAAGMKVLVHDPKEEPLINDLGYSVHPGTETNLVITKVELDNLPPPYEGSSCVDTNPKRNSSFKNPLKRYKYYSYSACKVECRIEYVLNQCQCVGYIMREPETYLTLKAVIQSITTWIQWAWLIGHNFLDWIKDTVIIIGYAAENQTVCDVYQFVTCLVPAIVTYNGNSSIQRACACFRPCEETKYTVTQSAAYFPSDYIVAGLETALNETEAFFRKNAIQLNIYYGELGYTRITQRPDYPSSSLFAEVGGLCGLFLGASLLTLAEAAEACMCVLVLLCKGGEKSKTKVQQITVDEKPKYQM